MSSSAENPVASAVNAANAADDDVWIPKIGMVFENDEKAYHFYCHYGKEMGFGVRKHLVKRRSSGLVYSRVFSCYKEGYCRTIKEGKKPRPDARSGCQAHVTVKIMDDGRFRVSEFEPSHNHELAPKVADEVTGTASNAGAPLPSVSPKNISTCRPRLKNLVPPKCMNAKKAGGAGSAVRYLQKGTHENKEINSSVVSGHNYYNLSVDNNSSERSVPKIDMEFENDEEAYQFYVNYAKAIGFSVRKHLIKRRASGIVFSRVYVCHKEGFCRRKEDQQGRSPKPYDRTGCLASMTVKITKNGRYRVSAFEPLHNHALVIPSKAHLVRWQWRKALVNAPNDSVGPEGDSTVELERSDEPIDEQDKNYPNLTFLYKNYIPSRCTNAMRWGDLGALMQYMHERQVTDPSFYYALQLDRNDQVTNIFWADTKSIVDFQCFGDAICFDSTYKTNDYGRPFAPFIGVNHHKQAIVFGAVFLYDESEESFKWLFETFNTAMHGKQPKLVLTHRSVAISNAIASVWQGTVHRYCVWQIYNDAAKNLNFVFEGSATFTKDFSKCLYDYENEEDFLSGWKKLLENYDLHSNEWLDKLYQEKEKWALAYDRDIFSADIKSTLVRENMNIMLKKFLDLELDLLAFMKHYEKIVDEWRQAEVEADLSSHQIVLQFPSSKMLKQVANAYTPAVFKVFQTEFEFSMDCMVYSCGQIGTIYEYKVNDENPKEHVVRFDSSNGAITCSCKRFEFVGTQCRHVLKTLDIINIKELPPQYILKRWTKEAKIMNLRENCMLATNGDTKSTPAKRYSSLCCIFNKIAVRAAEAAESYTFIESLSDQLMNQVVQILQTRPPEGPDGS